MPDFLMRSSPAYSSTNMQIDYANLVIHDVVAMQAGIEARGHGVQADLKTLTQFVEQGNSKKAGISGRFGHPSVSEQSAGRRVQRSKNFRVVGDKLIHDSHLLESARKSPAFSQDPIEFILEVAEKEPTEFAESVVASVDLVWVLDAEGSERDLTEEEYAKLQWEGGVDAPDDSIYQYPVMRLKPGGFVACDLVSEGALTPDGLFSASSQGLNTIFQSGASVYAAELFDLVDRWRSEFSIPLADLELKTHQLVQKYLFSRKDMDMPVSNDAITRRNNTRNIGRQALALEAQPEVDPNQPDVEEEVQEEDQAEEQQSQEEMASDEPAPVPPVTPPVTEEQPGQPQPAGANIAANLKAVQDRMMSLETQVKRDEGDNDRFASFQSQIDELSAQVNKLTSEMQTASDLLVSQADWIQKLSANVARIDGERVVTERIPRSAMNSHDRLEPVTPQEMVNNQSIIQHPRPDQFSAIDHMPDSLILAGDAPQTAAQKAVENQNRRQKAYRLQGSQALPR